MSRVALCELDKSWQIVLSLVTVDARCRVLKRVLRVRPPSSNAGLFHLVNPSHVADR